MTQRLQPGPVRFSFEQCDSRMVVRSVLAAVDHLCSLEDIDVELLDGLEVPVGECLGALDGCSIEAVDVEVVDACLVLEIATAQPFGDDMQSIFGDAAALVRSFFDRIASTPEGRLTLTGALQ